MLLQRMLAYCLNALLKLAALQKQLLQQFAVLAVGATALWRLLLLLLPPAAALPVTEDGAMGAPLARAARNSSRSSGVSRSRETAGEALDAAARSICAKTAKRLNDPVRDVMSSTSVYQQCEAEWRPSAGLGAVIGGGAAYEGARTSSVLLGACHATNTIGAARGRTFGCKLAPPCRETVSVHSLHQQHIVATSCYV